MSRKTLKDFPTFRLSRLSGGETDRKSTRLNSSHMSRSYAVFCLKKKQRRVGDAEPQPAILRWLVIAHALQLPPALGGAPACIEARTAFFFSDTPTTEIYTLSLHDALPIRRRTCASRGVSVPRRPSSRGCTAMRESADRKSTRLNSSHMASSYAVFGLR